VFRSLRCSLNFHCKLTANVECNVARDFVVFMVFFAFLPTEDNFIIEFSIWKRGSIGLEQLTNQLKCITQHALCDLLMEYLLLPAPLSSIPEEYFVTQTFKLRSLSAPPTPSEMSPRTIKVGEKSEPTKQGAQGDVVTPEKDGREKVVRKISSDSIKVKCEIAGWLVVFIYVLRCLFCVCLMFICCCCCCFLLLHPDFYFLFCLFVCLFACLFACLLFVRLFDYLFVCLFVRLFDYLFVYLFVCFMD